MPTPSTHGSSHAKSASRRTTTSAKSTSRTAKDGVALLKADHREVEKLFSQFEKARDDERKLQLAQQICLALRVHTQIEEEIFYPMSREVLKDDEIVNEAVVEHQSAKDLIEQIEAMQPSDEMFVAKVTVLQELISHHVEEEESEYFPQVQKTDMDLKTAGQQMAERKQELMAQMGDDVRATH